MADVTQLLNDVESGDGRAVAEQLPLVYDELKRAAAAQLAHEAPGQTFGPTALVHEVYLRLVPGAKLPGFTDRKHFFAVAAEAMRRILVESARRKHRLKRGGDCQRKGFFRGSGRQSDAEIPRLDRLEKLEKIERSRLGAGSACIPELGPLSSNMTLKWVRDLVGGNSF
jgi:RNA polymerase sigma factor (TIGR02999 family)